MSEDNKIIFLILGPIVIAFVCIVAVLAVIWVFFILASEPEKAAKVEKHCAWRNVTEKNLVFKEQEITEQIKVFVKEGQLKFECK